MKKILVAVDFSEHTDVACNYAFEMAKVNKAEICLFHTYFDKIVPSTSGIPDSFGINPYVNPEFNSEIEQNAKTKILELKNELIVRLQTENVSGVTIDTFVSGSDFETDLFDFCDDYHPSFVIIGTKGKGESINIFGNAANKIIDDLRFPVIALPEINNYPGIKNLMFVTDLHDSDDVLIRRTFNMLEQFDVKIYCVHVVEKSDYLKAYSKMEDLKLIYDKEVQAAKFDCDVLEGSNKQDEIDTFIKENNIDLIVFLPHKTNIFQRLFGQTLTKQYLFETNLPLLAVRI